MTLSSAAARIYDPRPMKALILIALLWLIPGIVLLAVGWARGRLTLRELRHPLERADLMLTVVGALVLGPLFAARWIYANYMTRRGYSFSPDHYGSVFSRARKER